MAAVTPRPGFLKRMAKETKDFETNFDGNVFSSKKVKTLSCTKAG